MKKFLTVAVLLLVLNTNAYELKFQWKANEETNIVKYKLTYGVSSNFTNNFDIVGRLTTNTSILLYSTNSYFFYLQSVSDIGVESEPTAPLFSPNVNPPADFRIIGLQVSTNLSSWNTILNYTNYAAKTNPVEFYRLTIK